MKSRSIDSVKPSAKNPRKQWSEAQAKQFAASLAEFGDLSGVVENATTGVLVGGHKRVEQFKADKESKIVITETLNKPDSTGTIAYGYITSNGTRYQYRRVRWDEVKEAAANIAANAWSAEWDYTLVKNAVDGLGKEYELEALFPDTESVLKQLEKLSAPPPESFPSVDTNIAVQHCCPKCGYRWSGKASR